LENNDVLESEIIDLVNNTVWWQIKKTEAIEPGQFLNFTYLAKAYCCGNEPLENLITVKPSELKYVGIGDGEDITGNNYDMSLIYGTDSASVYVICIPDIDIVKKGKASDESYWSTSISTNINTSMIKFKIYVTIEENDFDWLLISDKIPNFLSYAGYWDISNEDLSPVFIQNGQTLSWNFTEIANDETLSFWIYYETEILEPY